MRLAHVCAWTTAAWLAACSGGPTFQNAPPPAPPPPPPQQPVVAPPPDATDLAPPSLPSGSDALVVNHQSGLVSIAMPGPDSSLSVVQAMVRAGAEFASPGVAELAAEVLAAGSDVGSGRRNLRQRADDLGGTLDVQVGASAFWLTLRVPAANWQGAAEALLAALRGAADSRAQIERSREDLVATRSRAVWAAPDRAAADALLKGAPGSNADVANLIDRDASEVRQFLALFVTPGRTVLTVEAPGAGPALRSAVDAVVADARWRPPAAAPIDAQPTDREPATGIFWAPGQGGALATASLLVPLPDDGDPAQADAAVLLACLTLDGVGGRLEKLFADRQLGDLVWRPEWIRVGETPALKLTTRCSPLGAVLAWRTLQDARESLRTTPPTASELALAMRRATLTQRLLRVGDAERVRLRVDAALRSDASDRMRELALDGGRDAVQGLEAFLARRGALLVLGGEPPADVTPTARFELLPAAALAKLAGAPDQVQAIAGRPWLAPTLEAVGGAELLRRAEGLAATITKKVGGETASTETVVWRAPDRLRRSRTLVDQLIRTEIVGNEAKETLGNETRSLDSAETKRVLAEFRRHPLTLLAEHAAGRLEFKPIARRDIDGREVMILEAVGGGFERLRIQVEEASRLIRVVESWETLESGLRGYLEETWSDYRSAEGLRMPHHVRRVVDEGSAVVDAAYTDCKPLLKRP
jgi:hypothetical protein